MTAQARLEALGYVVSETHPATEERPAILHVHGRGVSTYVDEGDEATLASIADSHEPDTAAEES